MFIKQITIQGFKSYKDQTLLEPFSPGHNVIVGRNGSGKSNFFWAIRFVLSDAYSNMTREERQALLHEGSGPATISSFVQIEFDNSDFRFPTGKASLVLRRTIGLKKDEYSLDGKSVTKSEVGNLLESAGFSKSNPYYIVPQGRITSLTVAKDAERLALLKEVAGTNVYEQRRAESVKIMNDTDLKRVKICELLEFIDQRLAELESEKNELKEFQEADRDRRCLEYAIYINEQQTAMSQLDALETSRDDELNSCQEASEAISELEAKIKEVETKCKSLNSASAVSAVELSQIDQETKKLITQKTQVELSLRDTSEKESQNNVARRHLDMQSKAINAQIIDKQKELARLKPRYDAANKEEVEARSRLSNLQAELDILRSKQNRFERFSSASERDAFLNQSLKQLDSAREFENAQRIVINAELEKCESELQAAHAECHQAKESLNGRKDQLSQFETDFKQLRNAREEKDQLRKDLWREEAKLSAILESCKDELDKAERQLASTMDRNIARGLKGVQDIVDRFDIQGYHGPLYSLFDVDDNFRVAVEVVAGSSLFHVVVDDDEVASRILSILNQEKLGRVTFMPLNRLSPKEQTYPGNSTIPMINKLSFLPQYRPAILQVFGKAIICQDLSSAGALSRSHNLTAVTLEGDKSDRKGALTGGFHDFKASRLECAKSLRDFREKRIDSELALNKVKSSIQKLDQEISQCRDAISRLDSSKRQVTANREPLMEQIACISKRISSLENSRGHNERALAQIDGKIGDLDSQISSLRAEIGAPLRKQLTAADSQKLSRLPKQLAQLSESLEKLISDRTDLETQKNILEIELETNLKRRQMEISDLLREIDETETEEKRESLQEEIESLELKIADSQERFEVLEQAVEQRKSSQEKLRDALEKLNIERMNSLKAIEKQQEMMDKFTSKKIVLSQKRDAATLKIRELGVLPEEAYEKYQDWNMQSMLDMLHKLNVVLKKFSHVNRKAIEQYLNFNKQKESLESRKAELDTSYSAIQDLIKTLDIRKDEAIERTFEQVKGNFKEVWSQLVPEGEGRLVMLRRPDNESQTQLTQATNDEGSNLTQYIGISIQVSFNSEASQPLVMSQLSGGQKSLVALALIFAIQLCDPAPFYLFDEIDAALDSQYRTAVAELIYSQAKTAQFITTTFRPELLVHADKFYGVTFVNKVSRIQVISKDDATQFVEGQTKA